MKSSALVFALLAASSLLQAQTVDAQWGDSIKWREIGPMRGGRSIAASGVYGRPSEFYMGTVGGGLWKTTNEGKDWACVSDGFFETGAVGAIGVSPSNPDVVYVGMGETALRGNITWGDGVYKTEDGGKTWKHVGLKKTRAISEIIVDPKNDKIAYVAAFGSQFGPNEDRGVYKTTDGGKTWEKILFVSNEAGAIELAFEPGNPDVIYASTWQAFRKPWVMSSGGPGCKLFKSSNGGKDWTDLTQKPGLPTGLLGKITFDVSPANPKRIWAMVEHSEKKGLYRSDDAGENWSFVNGDNNIVQRPFYFFRVIADPKNVDTLYVLNVIMHKSTDGGKKWSQMVARHVDNHDLWIDPKDPSRMICSNDGGASVTIDGGKSWSEQDYPTAQFYHVFADNAHPYNLLGSQQDNSSVRIASRTRGSGITERNWAPSAGGESGFMTALPDEPNKVIGANYGGYMELLDHATGVSRTIGPWPENVTGEGADLATHRMQWTFPIVWSPHDNRTLYIGSQYVLRSRNLGQSWDKISPDLTRNDKARQVASGGPITKDNTGVEVYNTVFTVAESPKAKGTIWAGTDCGLVHVTRNGGGAWQNVTPKGLPANAKCSMIEASPHDPGTAYLAAFNHMDGDYQPYAFVTHDFGKSWKKITNGIWEETSVRVVREDPVRKGLLYAGTEHGVYVSFNGGDQWQFFNMNLPKVPIHDLVVKNADLCAATHGRSFWILDDVTPLRQMPASLTGVTLFKPDPFTTLVTGPVLGGSFGPQTSPVGKNAAQGLTISYFLPKKAEKLLAELVDDRGTVVASFDSSAGREPGLRRIYLTPRYTAHARLQGVNMWGGGPTSLKAPEGEYTVRLTVDGQVLTQKAYWRVDPGVGTNRQQMLAQWEFSKVIAAKIQEAFNALLEIRETKGKIERWVKDDPSLADASKPLVAKLSRIQGILDQVDAKAGQDFLNYSVRLINKLSSLLGVVQDGYFAPTESMRQVYQHHVEELDPLLAELKTIMGNDYRAFLDKARKKTP